MDLANNDQKKLGDLRGRLRYYVLQGEYLRKLQEMYKESNIINQNLQLSYQQYHDNRYSAQNNGEDRSILLKRIQFLQNQLRDIQQDINNIMSQLEKLESNHEL